MNHSAAWPVAIGTLIGFFGTLSIFAQLALG
jgi:hypothetical protein